MPGLLDFFTGGADANQTQGLLAAAAQMLQASGPSRMPTSFGQVLGQGLGAYQQSTTAARQLQQQQQLRDLQIKSAQSELDDQDLARTRAAGLQSLLRNFGQGGGAGTAAPASAFTGGQSAASMLQGLSSGTPAPAAQSSAPSMPAASAPAAGAGLDRNSLVQQHLQLAQVLRQGGYEKEAEAHEDAAVKLQPKYSTDFRVAMGADGKLRNFQLADDGTLKDAGVGVRPEVTEVDLGGTKQFVDKNTVAPGTTFNKTMTFADRQSAARLAFDQSQASSNQDAPIDPMAAHIVAQQYLAGDSGALQNIGRGAQGAQNLNIVRGEIAKQATAMGMTGGDIAAKMAEFAGTKAGQRTAGTRSANIEIAANEAAQLAPLAVAASDKVARSGLLPFGKGQVMFDANTNDPNLRQFAMANQALVTAYGQVMSRGGVVTVDARKHAEDLLSTAMDQRSYNASVSQMMQEINAARSAPKAVRAAISSSTSGREESSTAPAQQQAPAASQKFDMLPAATGYAGKRMRADNGTVYRSDGTKWIKE